MNELDVRHQALILKDNRYNFGWHILHQNKVVIKQVLFYIIVWIPNKTNVMGHTLTI